MSELSRAASQEEHVFVKMTRWDRHCCRDYRERTTILHPTLSETLIHISHGGLLSDKSVACFPLVLRLSWPPS